MLVIGSLIFCIVEISCMYVFSFSSLWVRNSSNYLAFQFFFRFHSTRFNYWQPFFFHLGRQPTPMSRLNFCSSFLRFKCDEKKRMVGQRQHYFDLLSYRFTLLFFLPTVFLEKKRARGIVLPACIRWWNAIEFRIILISGCSSFSLQFSFFFAVFLLHIFSFSISYINK